MVSNAASADSSSSSSGWRQVVVAVDVDRNLACLSIRCRGSPTEVAASAAAGATTTTTITDTADPRALLQEEVVSQLHGVAPEQPITQAVLDIKRAEVPLARLKQILRRSGFGNIGEELR